MSLSTKELAVKRQNPFEIYPKSTTPQPASKPSRAVAPAVTPKKPSPSQNVLLDMPPRKRVVLQPDNQTNPHRSQAPLKQRPALKKGLKEVAVQRAIKLLAIVVFLFVLLPSPVQKSVFRVFMPFSGFSGQGNESSLPVAYNYISSPFGKRWGRMHQGVDFAAVVGAPIYAATAGTVVHSGWESGYGKSIVIDHGNGLKTRYAHCSKLLVKVGAVIPKGGLIANVGSTGHSTGPHLHFEVIVNGIRKNPAWYYVFASNETPHLASAKD
jgi:murein DD-endopeptidase MepM/ murein hydrolase activator NlpD